MRLKLVWNWLVNQGWNGTGHSHIRCSKTEQAAIIASIRDDERGHNQMFRSIYRELTGKEIPGISNEQYQRIGSFDEGLQKALLGELSTVETYRKIWFGLPVGIYRDTVFGIILDELKHASKYNYLFTLNRTQK